MPGLTGFYIWDRDVNVDARHPSDCHGVFAIFSGRDNIAGHRRCDASVGMTDSRSWRPESLRTDNGLEFASRRTLDRAEDQEVGFEPIQPGGGWEIISESNNNRETPVSAG